MVDTISLYCSLNKPYVPNKSFITRDGEVIFPKCIKVFAFNLTEKVMVKFDSVLYASLGLQVNQKCIGPHKLICRSDGTLWICYKIKNDSDEKMLKKWMLDPETDVYTHIFKSLKISSQRIIKEQEKIKQTNAKIIT